MACESKFMYGIHVSRLSKAWKEVGNIHRRFYKKLMGVPNCAANGFADIELGRESRRGKSTVKYWYQIMCLDIEDLVKQY
jgi:hypothetical protein